MQTCDVKLYKKKFIFLFLNILKIASIEINLDNRRFALLNMNLNLQIKICHINKFNITI
jgi:hypothetical protein